MTYQENIANMIGTTFEIFLPIVGAVIVWILMVISMYYIVRIAKNLGAKKMDEDYDEMMEDDDEEEYDYD